MTSTETAIRKGEFIVSESELALEKNIGNPPIEKFEEEDDDDEAPAVKVKGIS